MSKRSRQRRRIPKPGESVEAFPLINPNAAGIDLGSRSHFVSVPEDRDERPLQVLRRRSEGRSTATVNDKETQLCRQ